MNIVPSYNRLMDSLSPVQKSTDFRQALHSLRRSDIQNVLKN